MGVAPHHEVLGVAGEVDPPVVSLEEEVGLLTSAGGRDGKNPGFIAKTLPPIKVSFFEF